MIAAEQADGGGGADALVGTRGPDAVEFDEPGGDKRLGALTTRCKPASDELEVNPSGFGHRGHGPHLYHIYVYSRCQKGTSSGSIRGCAARTGVPATDAPRTSGDGAPGASRGRSPMAPLALTTS